ncbi:MAG TPA: flagellar basal body L-ring protein FlgH [Acetobacteraceae bacterium]|nr:flagellar basal body L-ring protein FlgH [Acetobacteraceae bacterium]
MRTPISCHREARGAAAIRCDRALGPSLRLLALLGVALLPSGCGALTRLSDVGRPPTMTPTSDPTKDPAWRPLSMPMPTRQPPPSEPNALWRAGSRAFFKDQRAAQVGDVITIVVNMNDAATLNNVTSTTRASGESAGMPNFFGMETLLPKAVTASSLLSLSSGNNNTGTGQIKRNEAVTLSLAGVVTQVLPNGNLVIAARQEFRVNDELREVRVTGVVRTQDITSENTVQSNQIAEARIAYGGRGQLTDIQEPRWGQQMMDILLPF